MKCVAMLSVVLVSETPCDTAILSVPPGIHWGWTLWLP